MQNIGGIPEKDLVRRLKLGDQTAFELLFRHYYPGLVVYAVQFVADRAEAEEIVQDFFVRLWTRHGDLFQTDSLKNYFFSSVKNSSLNYLRHKKIGDLAIQKLMQLSDSHLVYDPDIYLATELQEKITQAIALLPEKCREIFIMSRFKGMDNEEIAGEMQISKRTVETHISNALRILRNELKNYPAFLILAGLMNF
jgi:RNA polymerase sigma-70 factor (ECF subfamily)